MHLLLSLCAIGTENVFKVTKIARPCNVYTSKKMLFFHVTILGYVLLKLLMLNIIFYYCLMKF